MLRFLIAILSVGWLWPMWVALRWWQLGMEEAARGNPIMNSFPYLHESRQLLAIAFAWLAVVVVLWAGRGKRSLTV